jgi:GT2 family glycosyltransferase
VSGHALLDLAADIAPAPRLSVITVLHGETAHFHRQCAAVLPALAALGAEAVVACNSPELHTHAAELARYARAAFDVPVRLLLMDGNAGFSAACNAAAAVARSDRLLLLNPDVFPGPGTDWAALGRAADALGAREVKGALLHYADGTVMHAGMAIERDAMPVRVAGEGAGEPGPLARLGTLLRVDHPHKGAEEGFFAGAGQPFPVAAVTGAFLLVHRRLWDELGGLSPDYVLAYHEDADFCLRARAAGAVLRIDPALRFVHLEGGGTDEPMPGVVGGAMLFNRCLFTLRHAGAPAGDLPPPPAGRQPAPPPADPPPADPASPDPAPPETEVPS